MKVTVFGATGQIGRALLACAPTGVEVVALTRADVDLADPGAIAAAIAGQRYDWIINAAAYTAVDKAESEPDLAKAINADAVAVMARAAEQAGAKLAQISTDFVFDGARTQPYMSSCTPNPLNVYGRTKWQGEQAAGSGALILRTSWVYRAGHSNFVTTMLGLMRERPAISVVSDQLGAPTHADNAAAALWGLVQQGAQGVHHYSDAGAVSWYEFAVAIQDEALALGLLKAAIDISPIAAADYKAQAVRPAYSVLDTAQTLAVLGRPAVPWRRALRAMLQQVKDHG